MESEIETMRCQRDFYHSLLAFSDQDSLAGLLSDALELLVARFGARETFIEVLCDDNVSVSPTVVARGCDEPRQRQISMFVSRGIISEALATGETVVTANAMSDPRFGGLESVQRQQLEAVLCVPIGRDAPIGVIYLQGTFGSQEIYMYGEVVQREIELVARALEAPIGRLLVPAGASSRGVASSFPRGLVAAPNDPFRAVLGRSNAISEVVARLRLAAPLDVSILLTGPSGAGKTLLANAIHRASRRRDECFMEINCATIPEALLENELFGAAPGGHSNVPKGGTKGKVEEAEGGTLFLDEVMELSLGAQAKLLQLLQSKTYRQLGGTDLLHADIRVIAATNADLHAAVAEKRFREDLYYRLQVLEARVPPLAERPEDLVPLSMTFLRHAVDKHQLSFKVLSPGALRGIQSAEWPGNVRQLAHRIESAAIEAHLRGRDRIEVADIFPDDARATSSQADTLQSATRRCQRQHVLAVLQSTEWNVLETARVLDVSRSHVYKLIRDFDLKLE